ncbi:DUF4247 domain-containing protein [Bacillus xiapuensis]|uniref:DUF4247 domain-containing protein n=1 Tax=Bacillus xiapuensis TaxID=2014075 RepID=UPI000C2356C6|nr:DUF4247 domain-containing protein [Bacillus xiapuensis]
MKMQFFLAAFLLTAISGLLAGCGNSQVEEYISEQYPLIDVVESPDSDEDESYIYQAEGKQVKELAKELAKVEKPRETGKYVNGKQVLLYKRLFIILTDDPDHQDSSLIEVSTEGFVRHHYHPGFFQGMLLGHILSDMFGHNWDKQQRNRCGPDRNPDCYNGYGSSGGYYGTWGSGSSGRGSTFRGGGPGAGK